MPNYKYEAYDQSGARMSGAINAVDEKGALAELKAQKLIPISVSEQTSNKSLFDGLSSRVTLSDLEFFTSELSLLLQSGVRIDKGIDIIRRSKSKPALASLLSDISQSLKRGGSLSAALKEHPNVFDKLYVNLVELGEASGELSDIFDGLAKDLKYKRDLNRKLVSALTYPAVIFFVCIASIFLIFNFIVPQMADLFSQQDSLPWYTQAMLSTADWMQNYQWFLVFGVVGAVAIGISSLRDHNNREKFQRFLLTVPGLKTALISTERIRFNSGLALMLKAGIQIDRALTLAIGNLKSEPIVRELTVAKEKIQRGGVLSEALQQTSLYPEFYVSLLEVGEASGNLPTIFEEIANRSRQDFESWTQRLTTLIEPLLILFMGVIVGGVVVVMLMSMVSVNDVSF
ncbi:general secretion pathway protein F [Idiomarina aquatica]|uniref:General secretion pathway protein F n=1 Tax=Idiomarina aquatica TaxID=1327752 RepID=A0A4R6PQX9_9GAMM|nr:type II secretion system F family protein [Idiomarina aquatica]TDP40231.1 general secretion pathway protein F [Idiomarina aquatica]